MASRQEEVRLELESHRADLREDLLRSGIPEEQVEHKLQEVFGDLDRVMQQTLAVQTRRSLHPTTWLFIFSVLSLTYISALFFAFTGSEIVFIWSGIWCVLSLGLILVRFWLEYFGLKESRAIYAAFLMSLLYSFSLTAILDINNFELTIHLIGLAIVMGIGMQFSWAKLSLSLKYGCFYLFSAVATFSAVTEQPLFGFLGSLRCLFIQPSIIPLTGELASCQQLPLWHPLLLLLYAVVLGGGGYVLYMTWGYIKNASTAWIKKVVLLSSLVSMGFVPALLPDLNRYGEVDIIPWKREIYLAYREILGRDPEEKDVEFYARSKAYHDMYHLKDVLYESEERKLKIDLLYQEIFHRHATPEEIEALAEQKLSVEQIREWLQQQL